LAPSVLQQLLASQPAARPFEQLLVGTETGDDAAVWRLDDGTCVIATTDFFMPMVDGPYEFGRIAATNAISDSTPWAASPARGSGATIVLEAASVPIFPEAPELVQQGLFTGASVRNWASYKDGITLGSEFPEWQRHLFTDPQTSGGLLIACDDRWRGLPVCEHCWARRTDRQRFRSLWRGCTND
jgi:selenophosphate synthase